MSKWCSTCYRNEFTGEWQSCTEDCPVFGKGTEKLAKLVISVKEILTEKNGILDSQEFGLSYSQVINYLEEIEEVLKG